MSRRLMGAFVLMVGLFVGMEGYIKPVAAIEVDLLIVGCDEASFTGDMKTDADAMRVMVSRASDGLVLVTQVFQTDEKQYADSIRYPAQPEGTVLTLSFGEWDFAYLQPPLVTDVPCDDTQKNRINQSFATVTRSPTLTPTKTDTPSAISYDMTATRYYWLVVTYGPRILTQLPPLPPQQPSPTPFSHQTKQAPLPNQAPIFLSRTSVPIPTPTLTPTRP